MDVDADLQAAAPSRRSNLGGIAVLAAGLFTMLLGFQTLVITQFTGIVTWIIPSMLLVGATAVVCGWSLRGNKSWAALGAVASTTLIAMLGTVWVYYSFTNGLVSLLALMVVPIGALAMVAAIINVTPARRADAARRRLAEQDLKF